MTERVPYRVLVVDDDARLRQLLTDFLEREGYAVDTVETAEGALARVETQRPDLVLLDLNLPGAKTGAAVVRRLSAATAVVIITGEDDIDMARRTLLDGAADFVPKPFALERISEVVRTAISKSRLAGPA